jgi:hypothetical protein
LCESAVMTWLHFQVLWLNTNIWGAISSSLTKTRFEVVLLKLSQCQQHSTQWSLKKNWFVTVYHL